MLAEAVADLCRGRIENRVCADQPQRLTKIAVAADVSQR